MNSNRRTTAFSIIAGFAILFFCYHLPELFQKVYAKPLIWLLESGMGIFLIVSYLVIRKQKGLGMKSYGLFRLNTYGINLLTGLFFGFVFFALNTILTVLLGWNSLSIVVSIPQVFYLVFLFSIGTLLPSLAEDILTRGYIFAHWPKYTYRKWMVVFSAVLFVLNHIFKLNRPDILIYLFVLGLWLAWCLVTTGSLWLTLGIHWGTNLAYQSVSNLFTVKTLRETGMENYLLALSYATGFLLMWLMSKTDFFGRIVRKA